jgi:hypothetical protein
MTTSPSRNDLATTFVHLHNTDVPVKVIEVSTAPIAGTVQRMKDLQIATFSRGRSAGGTFESGR